MKQIVCFIALFLNTISWGQFVGTPYIVPIEPSFQNTIVFQATEENKLGQYLLRLLKLVLNFWGHKVEELMQVKAEK
jgi:hypothetical protein